MGEPLFTALALVLVIEGLLYALLPETMQRMMRQVLEMPPETLRWAGLAAAATGVALAWWLRG